VHLDPLQDRPPDQRLGVIAEEEVRVAIVEQAELVWLEVDHVRGHVRAAQERGRVDPILSEALASYS